MRLERKGDSYVLDLTGREYHLLIGALEEHMNFRGDWFRVFGYSLTEARVLADEISSLTGASARAQGFPPVPAEYRRSPAVVETIHRRALEVFGGGFDVSVVVAGNRIVESRLTVPRPAFDLLVACLEAHIRLVGPGSDVDGFPHVEAQALSEALTLDWIAEHDGGSRPGESGENAPGGCPREHSWIWSFIRSADAFVSSRRRSKD